MQVITSMLKDMRSRQLHRHHHRSSVVAAIEDCAFTNQNCNWSNMPEELLREVLLRSINTDEMLSAAGGGRRRRGRKVVAAIEDCAFTNQNCSWSNMPELEWDFRLPLVKSINVSGHKYGLVYASVGWVIWRNKDDLPDELIFHINYLGVDQPTFTLNFSKGSSQIIAQYYQLIRLSFEGYRNIMENCADNAQVLKEGLEKIGRFDIVSKDIGVPLVAFSLKDSSRHIEFEVSDMLRRFGWIVPAYTMPADAQHITVLRVVIREDFSRTLAERLINDIEKVLHELDEMPARIDRTKITAVTETTSSSDGGETYVVVKKSEIETQREITNAWKKFVAEKKVKKSGVC